MSTDINTLEDHLVENLEDQIIHTIEVMKLLSAQTNLSKGQQLLLRKQASLLENDLKAIQVPDQ